MKTNELKNQKTSLLESPVSTGASGVSFDVAVYNEMSDQTAQNRDVIQMIEKQFEQMSRLNAKRSFLLKEISQYFKS